MWTCNNQCRVRRQKLKIKNQFMFYVYFSHWVIAKGQSHWKSKLILLVVSFDTPRHLQSGSFTSDMLILFFHSHCVIVDSVYIVSKLFLFKCINNTQMWYSICKEVTTPTCSWFIQTIPTARRFLDQWQVVSFSTCKLCCEQWGCVIVCFLSKDHTNS